MLRIGSALGRRSIGPLNPLLARGLSINANLTLRDGPKTLRQGAPRLLRRDLLRVNGNFLLKTITEPLALRSRLLRSEASRRTGGVSKPVLSPVEGGARWRKSTVPQGEGRGRSSGHDLSNLPRLRLRKEGNLSAYCLLDPKRSVHWEPFGSAQDMLVERRADGAFQRAAGLGPKSSRRATTAVLTDSNTGGCSRDWAYTIRYFPRPEIAPRL
jgi:hypothetical protein